MEQNKQAGAHPGRSGKAFHKEFLRALMADDEQAEETLDLFENMLGDDAIVDTLVGPLDIEEKFNELGRRIKLRLMTGTRQAAEKARFNAAEWTPWVNEDTPTARIAELERRRFLNERVIGTLLHHLGVHLALGMRLESLTKLARDVQRERERKLGKCVEQMALAMEKDGLSAQAAQALRGRRRKLLVAYLNDPDGPDGQSALAALAALQTGADPAIEAEFATFDKRRAEAASSPNMTTTLEASDEPILPVVPENFGPEWTQSEPVPPEFWSQFQAIGSNYRWEYSEVNTTEDAAIAAMPLPPADTYERLRCYRDEARFVPTRPISASAVRKLVAVFLQHATGQLTGDPDEALMKAWMWLIHGRKLSAEECDQFYGEGFFDGVAMPCPATGPTVFRTLQRV